MKKEGYYSSGEFAKMAHISVRTIRFYDQKKLLTPSYISPSGARFYTDYDFARLQQILLLKYLGFCLEDIRQMLPWQSDHHLLTNALQIQQKLIQERIEEMQTVEQSISATIDALDHNEEIDWTRMLNLIHLTAMENKLLKQYQNASNISARIRLHEEYSVNPQGWFPWILEQCQLQPHMRILEIGCGNGALWINAIQANLLPDDVKIVLSDISEGILHDARRSIEALSPASSCRFDYRTFDCHHIPFFDQTFDLVIANHVLFYCEDIPQVCSEVSRVLSPDGCFLCSTYTDRHMKEIRQLVEEYDNRIRLSGQTLYDNFGGTNGMRLLQSSFPEVTWVRYEDEIILTDAEPLVDYILSCHGNQNQYLLEHYSDFYQFLKKKIGNAFHITKDAGIFRCRQSLSPEDTK